MDMRPRVDLQINHVEWYVSNATARAEEFVDLYGFDWYGERDGGIGAANARSVTLRRGDIAMVLTEARSDDHPAASYVMSHGDGVADIAFRVRDAAEAYLGAVAHGAVPVAAPTEVARGWIAASVRGFGDVTHTLVQRPAGARDVLPGFTSPARPHAGHDHGLLRLDHLAVSLPSGDLAPTVRLYESAFGLRAIFEERIEVGAQAMDSVVVQSPSGGVTLVLIEPDPGAEAGQINDFLKAHRGPGVQHLAFATDDIVKAVDGLQARGVRFLETPARYYTRLTSRLNPRSHDVSDIKRLNILVDEDFDGQLFQIFTRSTHPRRTIFTEIIQRAGATTFGSGNIKALYEAVESTRVEAETL